MKTLFELYDEHVGKSSDKWSIYLETYHETLSHLQSSAINFLEIGVQNGGSLEIWDKYFPNARNIVGCDINEKCALLEYNNDKIKVVIDDSSTQNAKNKIANISSDFNVIIDDGSHNSSDIIKSFLLYFPMIEENGYYIIEDLHCSYWENFEGGLYDPYSSMAFLKKLADIPNYEHWGIDKSASTYLKPFYEHYNCSAFDQVDYSQIHSVQFVNSLCIIRKNIKDENVLGKRIVSGEEDLVVQGHKEINGTLNIPQNQINNPYGDLPTFPEMEWARLNESNILHINERKNFEASIEKLNRDVLYFKSIEDILRKELDQNYKKIADNDHLIHRLSHDNHALLTSSSWKITSPIRNSITHLRNVKKGIEVASRVYKNYGLSRSYQRAKAIYLSNGIRGIVSKLKYVNKLHHASIIVERKNLQAVSVIAEKILVPKVLIIAELSIPQCRKYRVDQKVELFKKLGISATVMDWTHQNECIEALQTHSLVIFYRVPGYDSVDPVFDECERLNLTTLWEVDDLIFDADILRESKTLQALDEHTYKALLEGAELYKRAMLKCSGAIASTQDLAKAMVAAGAKHAYVVENALDPETIITAQEILPGRKSDEDGIIRIVYGSGTTTHNIDFLEASDAILSILKQNKNVHFRLVGMLDLPESFDEVHSQIEHVGLCAYKDYLKVLAECDISLAPLEDYVFNYSKSNIKFIEASILAIPSICSPRPTFSRVIEHGKNGFLCESDDEWFAALSELISNSDLRKFIGESAKTSVMNHYSPESVANDQVKKIVDGFERLQNESTVKNVLSVNCFYNPRSFGGATIVAEEMNKRFDDNQKINIHVLTSLSEEYATPYQVRRYGVLGHECYGIGLPNYLPEQNQVINNNIDEAFIEVLNIVKPDLVHFHSIQGLGISMLEICAQHNIEISVTAHDYWWLYDHQFILSYDNKHKTRGIFNHALSNSSPDEHSNSYYVMKKRKALLLASKILTPSVFTEGLYKNEGFAKARLNKNGVNLPKAEIKRMAPSIVRFGYVGGNTDIKGFHLIKSAFKSIPAESAQITIVDNTLNLGYASFNNHDLVNFKNHKVIPAFTQETMDDFYDGIDVLLYPTQSKESFGLTVREALIRNVWVITSDAGGAPEDIMPGQNGLIIPFDNDAENLKKAILETIEHFKLMPKDESVLLPHSHIRSFDEQYEELADIYLSTH